MRPSSQLFGSGDISAMIDNFERNIIDLARYAAAIALCSGPAIDLVSFLAYRRKSIKERFRSKLTETIKNNDNLNINITTNDQFVDYFINWTIRKGQISAPTIDHNILTKTTEELSEIVRNNYKIAIAIENTMSIYHFNIFKEYPKYRIKKFIVRVVEKIRLAGAASI